MKILVSGGTGFLGAFLVEKLLRRNHDVLLMSRKSWAELSPTPCRIVHWPLQNPEEETAILECDAVIHLAGEPIAEKRWSKKQKEKLTRSRIQTTRELVDVLKRSTKLKIFISASAIGFYGDRKGEVLTEESHVGEGFLAKLCQDWELEAKKCARAGVRVAHLRTGVVLGRANGFLKQMEPIYKSWLGGPVGSGEQFLSWIHVQDWIRAVMFCLDNPNIDGPVNLVAPEPVTNSSFNTLYAELYRQPVAIPAPKVALKILLGEMAAIALDSQNVRPAKLLANDFKFKFSYLKEALWDLYEFAEQKHHIHDFYSSTVWVPASLERVFKFFSDENNLEKLSPPMLNFKVEKKSTATIMAGTLLDYTLKIHGVPVKWQTRIETWNPPQKFVDTQLKGPYALWHHTHMFEALAGGTLMKDRVHYRLPMGGLGRMFGLWLVKKDVQNIFSYRRKVIREIFKAD